MNSSGLFSRASSVWLACSLASGLHLASCSADAGKDSDDPSLGLAGGGAAAPDQGSAGTIAAMGGSPAAGGSAVDGPFGGGGAAGRGGTTGNAQGSAGASGSTSTAGTSANTGAGGSSPLPAASRVDNPFADARGYINPEWQAKARAEAGGERIANTPTAVWLDRIAAIEGTPNSQSNGPMGARDHLDAAIEQGAGYIQFVIYNLPGRDCAALASNGELGANELPRYKAEYIDPIAAIMGDAKYRSLSIINIIEVDSLPNLVTNTNVQKCAQMRDNGGYAQGVAYALQKLGALPNVYNYVDAGHHGWLGWDQNFNASAELFAQVARMAGFQTVAGFIANAANYSALREPFLDPSSNVGGAPLKQAKWIDWNPYVDELSYAQALRTKLVSLGFEPGIGMLIDTSRNGWGGSARPAAMSSATNVDTFVEESRIDRRIHAGNWCNQAGAGLGERPQASPADGIDAYVWVKPPGESDGASREIANDEGKGFDRMCDPTYGGNERNGNSSTGSLPDSPLAGAWFAAQFQELMRNAHPPL